MFSALRRLVLQVILVVLETVFALIRKKQVYPFPYNTVEVISIYASLASSALGHRGLQHFHRNTGFARFCGYFQINRDNLNGCDRS
jgi:hypothetical protein